jgi:hypothetical protein
MTVFTVTEATHPRVRSLLAAAVPGWWRVSLRRRPALSISTDLPYRPGTPRAGSAAATEQASS